MSAVRLRAVGLDDMLHPNAAVPGASLDLDVAVLPEASPPAVLHQPVVHSPLVTEWELEVRDLHNDTMICVGGEGMHSKNLLSPVVDLFRVWKPPLCHKEPAIVKKCP